MSDQHQAVTVIHQAAPTTQLHPLVQMMQASMTAGGAPDLPFMREMMQLQREWEAGEARKAFTRALVELKRDLPTVVGHDSVVDFQSSKGRTYYTHSSLASVMDAITGPLTRHGFSLAWTPSTNGNTITVTCRLTHSDGHHEETTLSGPADQGSGRNALQAIQSSITYLQRYSALSILGIATADMKEPEPEGVTADTIDAARNLAAIPKIIALGKTRDDAERFLGKKVDSWTIGDLDRLRAWVKPRSAE